MKRILLTLFRNRYFVWFILLFAYVQSVYSRMLVRQEINAYIFTPEAAFASLLETGLLFLLIFFFMRKWQRSAAFNMREILKIFATSILVYLLVIQSVGVIIAFAFDTIDRNFKGQAFVLSLFSDFLDAVIYGSFFLAYYYYHKNKRQQEQLTIYHRTLAERTINQLKMQLNPHFLFNNLNVLDQLIEEDKNKASDFLNEFAEIYRYVLQVSDREWVSLEEELEFANRYFKLIQHKYGDAYQLFVVQRGKSGSIVPLTLQLLIENAVKHNVGSVLKPICIEIVIDENLIVSNNVQLKKNTKTISGRALHNLNQQYQMLIHKNIEIHQAEQQFRVYIPVIRKY